MDVEKLQRVPPFSFSAVWDFKKFFPPPSISLIIDILQQNVCFFKNNVLRFLSLRYSADFRRSRLVRSLFLLVAFDEPGFPSTL